MNLGAPAPMAPAVAPRGKSKAEGGKGKGKKDKGKGKGKKQPPLEKLPPPQQPIGLAGTHPPLLTLPVPPPPPTTDVRMSDVAYPPARSGEAEMWRDPPDAPPPPPGLADIWRSPLIPLPYLQDESRKRLPADATAEQGIPEERHDINMDPDEAVAEGSGLSQPFAQMEPYLYIYIYTYIYIYIYFFFCF